MLANNITVRGGLPDGSDDLAEHTFALVKQLDGSTTRIATDFPLGAGVTMSIKHSQSGKPGSIVDRHLVQFTQDVVVGMTTYTPTVNLTISVPRIGDAFDSADLLGFVRYLTCFLGVDSGLTTQPALATLVAAIARGEG